MRSRHDVDHAQLVAFLHDEAHRAVPTAAQLQADFAALIRVTAQVCPIAQDHSRDEGSQAHD
jgi:hypothetical protein